jgi:hypothetical protein
MWSSPCLRSRQGALVIVPRWRFCLLPQNKSLRRSFVAVGSGLFRICTGLWPGWHKDEISARLLRGTHVTGTISSPSPQLTSLGNRFSCSEIIPAKPDLYSTITPASSQRKPLIASMKRSPTSSVKLQTKSSWAVFPRMQKRFVDWRFIRKASRDPGVSVERTGATALYR